jgi:hypothetical protein
MKVGIYACRKKNGYSYVYVYIYIYIYIHTRIERDTQVKR